MAEEESAEKPAKPEAGAPSEESNAVDPRTIRDRNRRIRAEAAEKRRKQREGGGGGERERRRAPARNLDTGEIVDDALSRSTHAAWNWLKRNSTRVQWVVVLLVVGGIGWKIYSYRKQRNIATATVALVEAVRAEHARVGEPAPKTPDQYTGLTDPRPAYPTDEERLKTAAREYREAIAVLSGPAAGLAELGLAGVLYDQGKYAEAKTAYEKVRDGKLGSVDRDARARAIEGIGLSLEAQGQLDPALAAFKQLENSDIPGFTVLGQYHQGRVLLAKGERDKAKELLKKAMDKLTKTAEKDKRAAARQTFVETQVRDLLGSIDPSAVPAPPSSFSPAALEALQAQIKASGGKFDPKQLEEFMKSMGANLPATGGGVPAPAMPSTPDDAPAEQAPAEQPPPAAPAEQPSPTAPAEKPSPAVPAEKPTPTPTVPQESRGAAAPAEELAAPPAPAPTPAAPPAAPAPAGSAP